MKCEYCENKNGWGKSIIEESNQLGISSVYILKAIEGQKVLVTSDGGSGKINYCPICGKRLI